MVRIFKHYVSHGVLLLGLLDSLILLGSAETAWIVRAHQIAMQVDPVSSRAILLLSFALAMQLAMVAVGVYESEALQSRRVGVSRLLIAISLGMLLLSFLNFLMPDITLWRSNALYAVLLATSILIVVRLLLGSSLGGDLFRRRLVVLGAGARAERIRRLEKRRGASFTVAGYVAMRDGENAVADAVSRNAIGNLAEHVTRLGASELVLALEERRNAIPMSDLLRV